jgi:hypothetical protein
MYSTNVTKCEDGARNVPKLVVVPLLNLYLGHPVPWKTPQFFIKKAGAGWMIRLGLDAKAGSTWYSSEITMTILK